MNRTKHPTNTFNRLESRKETYEPIKTSNKHIQPIRIKKQQESTD